MKSRKQDSRTTFKDTVAEKIASEIVRRQLWLSRRLSQWEQKLSKAQKKWLFLLFVGIAGGYCGFLLIAGLFGAMEPRSRHSGKALIVPVDSMGYRNLQLPPPRTVNTEREQNKNSKQ